jgi:single stranded DNA-binding protein
MNKVSLVGRLTREPELRLTADGAQVGNFTLAVNRIWKNADGERKADFIPVVIWRKQAEHCAKYLSKGSLVSVEGRIQARRRSRTRPRPGPCFAIRGASGMMRRRPAATDGGVPMHPDGA